MQDDKLKRIDEKANAEEGVVDNKLKSYEKADKSNVNETIFDGKSNDIDTQQERKTDGLDENSILRKRDVSAINSVKTHDHVVKGSQSIANAYDTDARETTKQGLRESIVKQSDFTSPRIINSYDSHQQ